MGAIFKKCSGMEARRIVVWWHGIMYRRGVLVLLRLPFKTILIIVYSCIKGSMRNSMHIKPIPMRESTGWYQDYKVPNN